MKNKTERIFSCSCDPGETMTATLLLEHLQAVHGMEENPRGERRLVEHIDGSDWYSTTYEWTFQGGVTVFETCTTERDESDPWRGLDDMD